MSSIRRYYANKDSTITNAFYSNLQTRAHTANMGESDILEVFNIFGQANTSSLEASRILIQFPIEQILSDRNTKKISSSGSCQFIFKLSNAVHSDSTPKKFNLNIHPLSSSWEEGFGLDMEQYRDIGQVNWLSSSKNVGWSNPGGDYLSESYTQYFENGTEDLEIDVTSLVERWISGDIQNNGVIIKLENSIESSTQSFYTKKFFARGSEYFFKRPWIEARSKAAFSDDRNNFVLSSSLLESEDNLNTLVLYNKVNGVLKNIPAIGTGTLYVSLYSGTNYPAGVPLILHNNSQSVEAGYYSTGIYTASIAVNADYETLFDVWHNGAGTQYATGSIIYTKKYNPSFSEDFTQYIININNLKSSYKSNEQYKFKVFVRNKLWNPNSYTVLTSKISNIIIENLYYSVYRISDKLNVIPYGTSSFEHTKLSYDKDGNYFDLDMSLFESDYAYEIRFGYKNGEDFIELSDRFKFRVE